MSKTTPLSPAVFSGQPLPLVDGRSLVAAKEAAARAERGRARICLHQDPGDPVQDMVIVHTARSFDRPHRHLDKSISILVLEGALLIPLFNDEGQVVERIELSEMGGDKPFLTRLSGVEWYSCIPLTDPVNPWKALSRKTAIFIRNGHRRKARNWRVFYGRRQESPPPGPECPLPLAAAVCRNNQKMKVRNDALSRV